MRINRVAVKKILDGMDADRSGGVCAKTFLEKLCFEYGFIRKFVTRVIR